ncbi:MAG TPA: nucleotidyltransferase domain-containing protein [Candidatus Latescibacteria bacterium]|nr:nucleotidyltransferase domain-containing protein [Candidatus Latescibacterota bacterium]HOS65159.1 nucleotidyltransferase domain-containing protein [Candidatus Latescibacterota bacterium]HPK74265.1 nucleotidyltransferase domain-containing protein [Candidatus Latescibacterota bacterium]
MPDVASPNDKLDPNQIVRRMAQTLVARFSPERVILFGSRARGDADPESDVDLLVVMPHIADRRRLRVAMRRSLNGLGLPKDVVVLTSQEFEAKRNIPGSIAYPANNEGKVLYADERSVRGSGKMGPESGE